MDRSTALDRISKVARTGYGVGRSVAGQLGRAAVGVSKAAGAMGRDVIERRRTRSPSAPWIPVPRGPEPATSTPTPPPAVPAQEEEAAVTSDVDATVVPPTPTEPSPADVARVVARKPRPKAPPTPAKRKPVKKSVPGAKLPPRKPSTEDDDKG